VTIEVYYLFILFIF